MLIKIPGFIIHRLRWVPDHGLPVDPAIETVAAIIVSCKIIGLVKDADIEFQFIIEHIMVYIYSPCKGVVITFFEDPLQCAVIGGSKVVGGAVAAPDGKIMYLCERCAGGFLQPIGITAAIP